MPHPERGGGRADPLWTAAAAVSACAASVRRMLIDCEACTVRPAACSDCVVTFLTVPVRTVDLVEEERTALDVLAASGLVPPLRLRHAG